MAWWQRGSRSAAVVAVAVALVLAGCASDGSEGATDRSKATTSTSPEPRRYEHPDWSLPEGELVAVPAPPAGEPTGDVTPIDDGFLLYAGYVPPPDVDERPAQVFDADTGTWTQLPPAPFDDPLRSPAVAAVPGGFLVVGAACGSEAPNRTGDSGSTYCDPGTIEAARYDLDDGAWRTIELPDGVAGDTTTPVSSYVVATDRIGGRVLLQLPGGWWRYEADGDTWTEVEVPSFDGAEQRACGTEAGFVRVLLADRGFPASEHPDPPTNRYVAEVLQDDGSWRATTSAIEGHPAAEDVVGICTPTSVVVLGGHSARGAPRTDHALTFDVATATWSATTVPPEPLRYVDTAPVADGAVVTRVGSAGRPGGAATYHYVTETQAWEQVAVAVEAEPLTVGLDGVFVGTPYVDDEPYLGDLSAVRLVP